MTQDNYAQIAGKINEILAEIDSDDINADRLTALLANADIETLQATKQEFINRFGTTPEIMELFDIALKQKGN